MCLLIVINTFKKFNVRNKMLQSIVVTIWLTITGAITRSQDMFSRHYGQTDKFISRR